LGCNMYLDPQQAARGIQLFSTTDQKGHDDLKRDAQGYPNLSKYDVYKT